MGGETGFASGDGHVAGLLGGGDDELLLLLLIMLVVGLLYVVTRSLYGVLYTRLLLTVNIKYTPFGKGTRPILRVLLHQLWSLQHLQAYKWLLLNCLCFRIVAFKLVLLLLNLVLIDLFLLLIHHTIRTDRRPLHKLIPQHVINLLCTLVSNLLTHHRPHAWRQ